MIRKRSTNMMRRYLTIIMSILIILSDSPVMVVNRVYEAEAAQNYDPGKAIEYAKAHWNDGQGLCAEFVSRCAQAAGCNISVYGYTIDAFEAISNATGVQSQDLILDANGYATQALDGDRLAEGDVVIQWCYTHGTRPHILICGGYNSSGIATFYAHNSALNNGVYRLGRNTAYNHTTSCNMGAKVLHLNTNATVSPSADNPGAPYPIPTRNLSNGCTGDDVRWVQKFANDVHGEGIAIDGIYGNDTAWQVKYFQQQHGLTADSIAGPITINAMLEVWREHVKNQQNKDITPPVIMNVKITNLSSNGYTITCTVTDNVALDYVKIHTWTEKNGQDDMKIEQIVSEGGTISYRVNTSDHNNETGNYVTHIYAYDKAGNLTPDNMGRTVITIPNKDTTPPVISNIQITNLSSNGYTLTCTVTDDVALDYVKIHTWTEKNGQDDMKIEEIVSKGGTISYRVNTSDHNNETGNYVTHIYAYDKAGNLTPDNMGRTVIAIPNSGEATDSTTINLPKAGNGWKQDSKGWWYQNADGTYPKNTWKKISGKWYHFDASGYMQTGWYQEGSIYYYLKSDGSMAVDEWVDNGKYYVDANGKWIKDKVKVVEGWKQDSKGWWYQNADGTYPKNTWKKISDKWYHFGANGYMQTGWYQEGSIYYYLKSDGSMAADEWVDNGKYYVDAGGKWIKDKVKVAEGWKQDSKGWWYQNADGTYPKNTWKQISGKWYHFDANGYMQTGWYQEGSTYYYLKSDGSMATDEWVDNGKYYVDNQGHWIQGKTK